MLENARFFHQFAALLNAGIPVQQSLSMARRGCSANLQHVLKKASLKVEAGQDLVSALNTCSPYFDQWTIALIRAAEYSGALAETFERLAIAAETWHRRQKLYSAAIVSTITIVLASLALLVALVTRSTAFLFQPAFLLVAAIAIAVLFLRGRLLAVAGASGQAFMAKVPLLKGIAQARSLLYFTELELPLRCGIPMLQALELIRLHMPDLALRQSLAIASRQMQAGQTLSQSLVGKLPLLALQMISTGEETGNLDEMLGRLAAYYESDLERQLKQLQSVLQPLSIVAAGGLVLLVGLHAMKAMLKVLPG
jgi:type II secretory pathway component PulF